MNAANLRETVLARLRAGERVPLDWPGFRTPAGDLHAEATELERVTDAPGLGGSSHSRWFGAATVNRRLRPSGGRS